MGLCPLGTKASMWNRGALSLLLTHSCCPTHLTSVDAACWAGQRWDQGSGHLFASLPASCLARGSFTTEGSAVSSWGSTDRQGNASLAFLPVDPFIIIPLRASRVTAAHVGKAENFGFLGFHGCSWLYMWGGVQSVPMPGFWAACLNLSPCPKGLFKYTLDSVISS